MTFSTQYTPHKRVFCAVGSREKITYSPHISESGVLELVPDGKINLYAEIQAHKDSVDIYALLDRFNKGDATALSKVQGLYGDFSDMPKTYADLLNVVVGGEDKFNRLPLEVKQKFNNSFFEFVASAGTGEWLDKMGIKPVVPSSPAPVENPVVEKEVTE